METWLLYASILICILCFQNIYVQVKRNGSVLIWYSVSNSFLSLSYVIGGITLHNDFTIDNASTSQRVWCGIGGVLLSLSSVANAGLALALSIELFVSLRLTNPAARQDPRIKRSNIIFAFVLPLLSVLISIITLIVDGDKVFTNFDDGGVCEVSRHGAQRGVLFVFRTLPEYLPIFPSCVLSVLALIPIAQKVFENRRLQNSLSMPWTLESKEPEASVLPTRGGPPPNPSIPPNAKMLLPRNVLLRMGLWCCLLIIFGIPTSISLLKTSIEYLISGNERLNYLPDVNVEFLKKNGNTLHMVFIMALFLLCFGTGKFANEQYRELWDKIFGFIFCSYKYDKSKHSSRSLDFEMVHPTSRGSHGSNNRVSPTTTTNSTPASYVSHPPYIYTTYNDSYYPVEYQNVINVINHNNYDNERTGSPSELIMIDEIERPKSVKLLSQIEFPVSYNSASKPCEIIRNC